MLKKMQQRIDDGLRSVLGFKERQIAKVALRDELACKDLHYYARA